MFKYTFLMVLHAIQKYNTIRMIDEWIRYPIYLASALESAPFKSLLIYIHRDSFQHLPSLSNSYT